MGIPSAFARYLESLLGFETTKYILDGTGHYVVDAGHAVGTWRPLEEGETRRTVALVNTLLKHRFLLPKGKYFRFDLRPI